MFKSTLTGDYVHYYSKDPAFDTEEGAGFDHAKWVETKDMKYLPLKNGITPVTFTLRRLGPFERQHMFDMGEIQTDGALNKPASMLVWAVALGVRNIEPLFVDGKEVEKLDTVTRGKFRVLSDEWIMRIQDIDNGALFGELVNRVLQEGAGSPRS